MIQNEPAASRVAIDDRERLIGRRRLLQLGGLGSLSIPGLFRALEAQGAPLRSAALPPIRSCILIFNYGGPSHLETWDLKPDAPAEVRGEFQPISTSLPGLTVCEHLPHMAQQMHKVAVIRSMSHLMRAHDSACTETFTGRTPARGDGENFAAPEESLAAPGHGAILTRVRRKRAVELPHAVLPFFIRNLFPPPGQGAGFLGPAYAPFLINGDPRKLTYNAELLRLADGMTRDRLDRREAILSALEDQRQTAATGSLRAHYDKAFGLLASETVRRALDIEQEPRALRERYGLGWKGAPYVEDQSGGELDFAQQLRGQNLLMARRLVEAGVPFINVSDFKVQGANWDTHSQNIGKLKGHLLPAYDQSLSALIDDLDQRGLLESTLVVSVGEFGRTPKINKTAGRDHWPDCYSAVLIGGGVRGGAIFGGSDKIGAYPAADPVSPGDLAATIFWRFGVDPTTEIHDSTGRPYRVAEGAPVRQLFEG
jgi:hypothetical protein